jgi:predicted ATPase
MYAENDFQLLEARTGDVRVELPWRRKAPYMNPHVVFNDRPATPTPVSFEHITAVIGKNGTGKSHLLTSVVQTFIALEELQTGRKESIANLPLDYLSYNIDGRYCSVKQLPRRRLEIRVDGVDAEIGELPLPRRVVALTISPFDKFPVPRPARHSAALAKPSIYHYLGLRDRFNKASIETLLFRALNNLFEESDDEPLRRINIGSVFEYLDLEPTLTVIYRVRIPNAVRNAVYQNLSLSDPDVVFDISQQRRVSDLLAGGMDEDDFRELLHEVMRHAKNGMIRSKADFRYGGELDESFRRLQPLRRAGFLRLTGVEVVQTNGLVTDLKRASSGQLSMISALLALASVIRNASLVLIDEPELSLHPEWQIDYVGLLIRTFSHFRGCHFVIATHSPMVVSELPLHANVIALDRTDLPPVKELKGQSADYLLAEVFGAPSPGNLYVRERIVSALELVAKGEVNSPEFAEALANLQKLAMELDPDDPAGELIVNLEDVARDAGTGVR